MKIGDREVEIGVPSVDTAERPIRYRPDIDGLRAIAVLAVVGYHLFPEIFPGGFVGVDIFFVISGYLISSIVIREASDRTFSFVTFYARRARRILPALLFVSIVAMICESKVFFAPQILAAYRSLIAALLFSGNIYFLETTGYFEPAVTQLPFLHFWSLGVEEQYYLFFPLVALAARRFRRRAQIGVYVVIALFSLIGSELTLRTNPSAAYFLIQWRAWELTAGILAYYILDVAKSKTWKVPTVSSWLGIGLIGFSIVSLNAESAFPGVHALPACLGASLIIVSGARTQGLGNRILGTVPLRAIGRMSYSLYLVHWPVFVIASAAHPDGRGLGDPLIMFILSFVLATANYALVERPIRYARLSSRNALIVSASALTVLLLSCEAGAIYYQTKVEHARLQY